MSAPRRDRHEDNARADVLDIGGLLVLAFAAVLLGYVALYLIAVLA